MEMNVDQLTVSLLSNINYHVLGKKTDSYDVLHMAKVVSSIDSAQYLIDNMLAAANFESDLDLLSHGMGLRPAGGLVLEFGVASGRTLNHLASLTDQKVYGFDVFSGLPEDWRSGFAKGAFAQSPPQVRENAELVVGLFEDTIPPFLSSLPTTIPKQISLLHVDCDLYSSTKTIFNLLGSRIGSGTVIIFDEYFNYPGWRYHEYKAFQEFISFTGLSYKYNSFVSKHQQVCVLID